MSTASRRRSRMRREPLLDQIDWFRTATFTGLILACLGSWFMIAWGAAVLFRRLLH